jgi:prepilin-type N-terminal cleavage/methylation domain-containing protein
MDRPGNSESGFTLIELLVAASLASIGFLGLAALHANALRTTAVGRNLSVATSLASEEIEALRRLPASSLVDVDGEPITVGHRVFTRSATIAGVGPGTAKQVTVDVTWSDAFGAHDLALVSVIGQ